MQSPHEPTLIRFLIHTTPLWSPEPKSVALSQVSDPWGWSQARALRGSPSPVPCKSQGFGGLSRSPPHNQCSCKALSFDCFVFGFMLLPSQDGGSLLFALRSKAQLLEKFYFLEIPSPVGLEVASLVEELQPG